MTRLDHAMRIRPEQVGDIASIRRVVTAAFAGAPHASGTEAAIVDGLRRADVLAVSLVADENGEVVGHVAFSPVWLDGELAGWFGLGPVAVRPDRQGEGLGQALIRAGLERLKALEARGCVVLGEPAYYRRFGFGSRPGLRYGDVAPQYFQSLSFSNEKPVGRIDYHSAFRES
jgi:putative acetyltransferase